MILQELYQLAKDERLVTDIDYAWRTIAWIIDIREDGSLRRITDYRRDCCAGLVDKYGKPRAPQMVAAPMYCPLQFYRAGNKAPPHFLADTARYVFAYDPDIAQSRATTLHGLFLNKVAACAVDTGHEAPRAVVRFLEQYAAPNVPAMPEGYSKEDMFVFRVAGLLVHHCDAVQTWWRHDQAKQDEGTGDYQCLVTGEPFKNITLFPKTSGLPGATSDIKLVSCDKHSFWSHGWKRNENAPISRKAGVYIATGLARLLAGTPLNAKGDKLPRRSLRIPGGIALCYWAHDPSELETRCLNNLRGLLLGQIDSPAGADHATVDKDFQKIWAGEMVDIPNPSILYVLAIAGGLGRATVRGWNETTLTALLQNLVQHYRDMQIVHSAVCDNEPTISLTRLLESLIVPEGKSPKIPTSTELSIIQAALHGGPYPRSIQGCVLRRQKAEIGKQHKEGSSWQTRKRMDARMALLIAYMNRRRRFDVAAATKYPRIEPHMDPTITSAGYCMGMLLSLLERIQQAAAGAGLNSTITDRHYSAASTTPRTVFPRLLRLRTHHMAKALKKDPLYRVMAWRCDRLVGAILNMIDPARGLPARLDSDEQAMFVLGYHQMQCWLYMSRDARAVWEAMHPSVDAVFRWQLKSDEEVTAAITAAEKVAGEASAT